MNKRRKWGTFGFYETLDERRLRKNAKRFDEVQILARRANLTGAEVLQSKMIKYHFFKKPDKGRRFFPNMLQTNIPRLK